MKKDNIIEELTSAVDALSFALKEFNNKPNHGITEQSELLKNYYLLATKLTRHVQSIDDISLIICERIQIADKQNDISEADNLEKLFDISIAVIKLCEEFSNSVEIDIGSKQFQSLQLRSHIDALSRKLFFYKENLTKIKNA